MKRNCHLAVQTLTKSSPTLTRIMQNTDSMSAVKKQSLVHADVHSRDFKWKCPADGSDLIEIEGLPPLKCPRCNQNKLVTEETKPIDEQQHFAMRN